MSQFTVQLELNDLVSANRYHIIRYWTGRRALKLLFWLVFLFSGVVTFFAWDTFAGDPRKFVVVPILGLGMAIANVVLCAVFGMLLTPLTSKNVWMQSAEVRKPANWSFGDRSLLISTIDGEYGVRLDEVHKWAETSTLFLLYVNDQMFRLLTKRSMSAEQQDRLRSELRSAYCPRLSFATS